MVLIFRVVFFRNLFFKYLLYVGLVLGVRDIVVNKVDEVGDR